MNPIQWFPGHMAKARRQAQEQLPLVDIVVELVDARVPDASRNPVIDEIIGSKKRLIVLNKADLADPPKTAQWLAYYEGMEQAAISINAQQGSGIRSLEKRLSDMMREEFEALKKKGVKERPIRLMILGIPNVGKSTLINRLVGKNQAQTGNRPGVTRAQRWLKFKNQFELLDTPGILWPKFEDPLVGKKLAVTGAIKDSLLHMDDLALYILETIQDQNPQVIEDRYQVEIISDDYPQLLMDITEKMGLKDDYEQASERILHDFRQGRLGKYTLDPVPQRVKVDE